MEVMQMSYFEKVYSLDTNFEILKKENGKIGNLIYNFIHKEKVFPFSDTGLVAMKQDNLKYKFIKFNNRFQLQYLGIAICSVLLLGFIINSAPYWLTTLIGLPFMQSVPCVSNYTKADQVGNKIVELGQYGIKKLSMAVVFYGLYVQLLKKDDAGKKISMGAGITYILSLLVPEAYNLIDGIFK